MSKIFQICELNKNVYSLNKIELFQLFQWIINNYLYCLLQIDKLDQSLHRFNVILKGEILQEN